MTTLTRPPLGSVAEDPEVRAAAESVMNLRAQRDEVRAKLERAVALVRPPTTGGDQAAADPAEVAEASADLPEFELRFRTLVAQTLRAERAAATVRAAVVERVLAARAPRDRELVREVWTAVEAARAASDRLMAFRAETGELIGREPRDVEPHPFPALVDGFDLAKALRERAAAP